MDNLQAGSRKFATGEPVKTFTEQGAAALAEKAGASPETAGKIGAGTDIAISLGAGGAMLYKGVKAGNAAYARAEAEVRLLGRDVSIAAQTKAPSARDIAAARELAPDLAALPKDIAWTSKVINSKDPRLGARLAEAGLDDLVGWEGKVKALRQAGVSENIIAKLRAAAIASDQPAINTLRILTAPNGQQIALPPIASLKARDAQEWHTRHARQIPDLIDKTASLEQQARQGFELRNAIRNGARSSMKNREGLAQALVKDPDKTWIPYPAKTGNATTGGIRRLRTAPVCMIPAANCS